MTSLGNSASVRLLECEILSATTIFGDLQQDDVSTNSLKLENMWKFYVDESSNLILKNIEQNVISLTGDGQTGELTLLGDVTTNLDNLTDVSADITSTTNGAMFYYNASNNKYEFTSHLINDEISGQIITDADLKIPFPHSLKTRFIFTEGTHLNFYTGVIPGSYIEVLNNMVTSETQFGTNDTLYLNGSDVFIGDLSHSRKALTCADLFCDDMTSAYVSTGIINAGTITCLSFNSTNAHIDFVNTQNILSNGPLQFVTGDLSNNSELQIQNNMIKATTGGSDITLYLDGSDVFIGDLSNARKPLTCGDLFCADISCDDISCVNANATELTVSGDLYLVNGALRVGPNGENGHAGEVLTSQGIGSPPTWVAKQYVQWYLPSSQLIVPSSFTQIKNTTLDIRSSTAINHNAGAGTVTLDRAGIYMITYNIQIIGSGAFWSIARCMFNGTPLIVTTVNDGPDTFYNAFHSASAIVDAPAHSTISFEVRVSTSVNVEGFNNPKPTVFTVHSID